MAQPFAQPANPFREDEWAKLLALTSRIANSSVSRKLIAKTRPLGPGFQTLRHESIVTITDGLHARPSEKKAVVEAMPLDSSVIPIIYKDFTVHWRDIEEARTTSISIPLAKAAVAASACSRCEDSLVLFGTDDPKMPGLTNVPGRNIIKGARWDRPGSSFNNVRTAVELLLKKGHKGPYGAIVTPWIFAAMHNIQEGTTLLEFTHVSSLTQAGIFWSSLLPKDTVIVVSGGNLHLELVVAIDTSLAFLKYKKMNPMFRVLQSEYLRILQPDSLCCIEP